MDNLILIIILLGIALAATLLAMVTLYFYHRRDQEPHQLDVDSIYQLGDRNA